MSLPTFNLRALGLRLAIFAFVIAAIFCFKLWQPKRQIELHQKNLLLAVENKNWRRAEAFLSEKYSDRFGYQRKTAIAALREVMRSFFSATIRSQGAQLQLESDRATVSTNLTLTGSGPGGFTETITSRVNQLTDPWIFTWKKESAWPWDWKLISADNSGLSVSDSRGAF